MYRLRFETTRITFHCEPRVNHINPEPPFLQVRSKSNDVLPGSNGIICGGSPVNDIHQALQNTYIYL